MGPLTSAATTLIPINPQDNSSALNTTSIILIAIFSSIAGLLLITGSIILYLKHNANNKVVDEIVPEFSSGSEGFQDKTEKKKETVEVQYITEENIS
jgi:hypothetical protein